MSRIVYLTITIFSYYFCYSQNAGSIAEIPDSVRVQEMKNALNLGFSKVVSGSSFSNFGNYAGLSSTDESLKASVSLLSKKGNILSVKAAGGATEGVSAFFKDWDVNSSIGLSFTYNFMIDPFNKISISRDALLRDDFDEERRKVVQSFVVDTTKVFYKLDSVENEYSIQKLDKALTALKKKSSRATPGSLLKDSLDVQIALINIQLKVAKEKRESYTEEYFISAFVRAQQIKDKKLAEIKMSIRKIPAESIDVVWISIGYGFENNGFKLIDSTLSFDDQVIKRDYTSQSFNVALSRYSWKSYSPYDFYWSLGFSASLSHNLSSLTAGVSKDIKYISKDPRRELSIENNVYSGDYKSGLMGGDFFFDYYQFFGFGLYKMGVSQSSFALHLKPQHRVMDKVVPTTSVLVGIMVPFRKVDEEASFVNLEVFYQFNDILNTAGSKNNLLTRNMIGLSVAFPITFF